MRFIVTQKPDSTRAHGFKVAGQPRNEINSSYLVTDRLWVYKTSQDCVYTGATDYATRPCTLFFPLTCFPGSCALSFCHWIMRAGLGRERKRTDSWAVLYIFFFFFFFNKHKTNSSPMNHSGKEADRQSNIDPSMNQWINKLTTRLFACRVLVLYEKESRREATTVSVISSDRQSSLSLVKARNNIVSE